MIDVMGFFDGFCLDQTKCSDVRVGQFLIFAEYPTLLTKSYL